MNQPDLHELARECDRLYDELGELDTKLSNAEAAAYGDYDEKKEEAIEGTGSGDQPESFNRAQSEVAKARLALAIVQEFLAQVQGFRDFDRTGAVS